MNGSATSSAKTNADDGKGAPENGRNDPASGSASPLGRITRLPNRVRRGPSAKIDCRLGFADLSLTGRRPNGECRNE